MPDVTSDSELHIYVPRDRLLALDVIMHNMDAVVNQSVSDCTHNSLANRACMENISRWKHDFSMFGNKYNVYDEGNTGINENFPRFDLPSPGEHSHITEMFMAAQGKQGPDERLVFPRGLWIE
jgi:hypothetical protein